MSLPALEWRKLPVRTLLTGTVFTSSYCLDVIYDMLTGSLYFDGSTRTVGSGSAWKGATKVVTGANTEAVYCRPPLETSLSQSVIFSAKNSIGTVSAATPPILKFENTYSASFLWATVVKNATGSFTEWTSLYPFGSGSFSLGYAHFAALGQMVVGEKIVIYESKEAIAVSFYNPVSNVNHMVIAGAIIDPEQTGSFLNTEADGRLYAMTTCGTTYGAAASTIGMNPLFHTVGVNNLSCSLFNDYQAVSTATSAGAKFQFFFPRLQGSSGGIISEKYLLNPYSSYTTISGKLVQNPVRCVSGTDYSGSFVGRIRDVNIIKNLPNNTILRDSSNAVVGFAVSANDTGSASHTYLLKY
jgi:hypothetical protein